MLSLRVYSNKLSYLEFEICIQYKCIYGYDSDHNNEDILNIMIIKYMLADIPIYLSCFLILWYRFGQSNTRLC